jgi:hypothetical protein
MFTLERTSSHRLYCIRCLMLSAGAVSHAASARGCVTLAEGGTRRQHRVVCERQACSWLARDTRRKQSRARRVKPGLTLDAGRSTLVERACAWLSTRHQGESLRFAVALSATVQAAKLPRLPLARLRDTCLV